MGNPAEKTIATQRFVYRKIAAWSQYLFAPSSKYEPLHTHYMGCFWFSTAPVRGFEGGKNTCAQPHTK